MNTRMILVVALAFLGAATGCKSVLHHPTKKSSARLGEETPLYRELTSLPQPQEPIVAAVYKFRDHTGQYKPSENGASWSTAVTQGATSILIRALEESGWFVPIERENLSNLLNERKIIRSSRAQYQENPAPLPPLLFAGVVLEGGIVSYQSNVVTGGAGLRYFGAGASGQYREDKVNIYLRAVSTSNGKILKTVYTSKTILSQVVDVGLFRFVKFERLLEVETGYTYNEPSDMAVTEAIEKAVIALVIDGAQEGLWQFGDKEQAWSSKVVKDYMEERESRMSVDEFGKRMHEDLRGKFGIGINGGGWLYAGDYPDAKLKPYYEMSLNYNFTPKFSLALNAGKGELAVDKGFSQEYYNTELLANYRFAEDYKFTPYLFGGISVMKAGDLSSFSTDQLSYHAVLGLGFEQSLNRSFDLNFGIYNSYCFNDELDGEIQGNYNDFFWGAKVGLRYYPRRRRKESQVPEKSPVIPAPAQPQEQKVPEEGVMPQGAETQGEVPQGTVQPSNSNPNSNPDIDDEDE